MEFISRRKREVKLRGPFVHVSRRLKIVSYK